ncbi:tRNA pseudouridine(38-40) synthase TruA [candidate division WOR-1 bacterium RIFOXYC2_FULL_37_10]|uniref:tRNA pseudouridine synthase A n=1 Tax=candidate division WOR-1 bacterium RIFOXYB2_FULL_37_13 TaxID=1802579 RepID=A0A1F4SRZ5_UNCSA|nr:MAG: tRNA pseudouridine(38-40) synthase TruA [candidate division WOR-1 bacterium RIFOXYA2_FULL_37_7]OGC23210.1 MAG: tRNA pseudouridine(38-40) synthase TruA [candidate division WOR-1 bacterium RIFOXYB2_FULL_37_13]OGC37039.1 MAG: tRNA pseudouridine(38-40) synthase TruA [candidate division WOR-1 bacterium RIFOXYC2_FULL_37_10]
MSKVLLTIQYDGSSFSGYELQPDKRSVRGELENALSKIFGQKIDINAVSRTDAGVHAISQIVSFSVDHKMPAQKIAYILNAFLPPDIRAIDSKEIKSREKIRHLVKYKEYQYLIFNGKILPPFFRHYVWHLHQKLDLKKIKKAAKYFEGKYNFKSFCASRSNLYLRGKKLKNSDFVRTIYKVSISNKKINLWDGCSIPVISLKFKGDGFLYKMIRNIVGTLVEVGLGKREPSDIKKIIAKKSRKYAGRCAPGEGLCLVRVSF